MHAHIAGVAALALDARIEGLSTALAVHAGVAVALIAGIQTLSSWHDRHDRAAMNAYRNGQAHHDERGLPILCGGCGRNSWDGNPVSLPDHRCALCLDEMYPVRMEA